jgi:hypothetical protein
MKTYLRVSTAIGLAGFAALAFADCEMRATTAKEVAYAKQVVAGLKGALPAAPPGWTLGPVRDDQNSHVCADTSEGNFDVRLRASYTYQRPKAESDRAYSESRQVDKEIDKLRELPPDVAKERQAWLDKMSAANRASRDADKKGDKTLARQLDSEAEAHSKKGREIRDSYWASIRPQIEELEKKKKSMQYGNVEVNVSLVANEQDSRRTDPQRTSELTFGKTFKGNKTGLKVLAIRAIVEGPAPEREVILKAIEQDKLARLIQ